ncbi:UvrD-helicase domain-containing protein [Vibrio parahaemolyticus]|nr:DNA helicase UvrD [Vibrio parahaemolyticus]MBY8080738.1 ATP-binding domain-containing protein [Vibrio fluvialis]EHR4994126.1 UvrD-helicase domain-containing protein [Vibrio parahaemolyticus]EHR6684285.1 UvrD-helicase domain-containing protein [Vibrio parahaemolyticus]EIV8486475.1 UvrD-helicase domain-containing protein [Vibrio parahaemolyticus]
MIKFIAIDINAAKEIVKIKDYQSVDYKKGKDLIGLLKEGVPFENKDVFVEEVSEGWLIRTDRFDKNKTLVFDITEFHGFSENNDRNCITLFQKSCRLVIKLWEGMGLSSLERAIDNRFVILTPFSFRTGYYKVALDKRPDQKRQDRRNSQHFLIFGSGNDQFELNTNHLTTNYKKAVESYKDVNQKESEKGPSKDDSFSSMSLEMPDNEVSAFIGFNGIEGYLTENQKIFINSSSLGPARLDGAAGTGKTLSLILRCIKTLNHYKNLSQDKKLIFITHSSETKNNIKSIFRANNSEDLIYDPEVEKNHYVRITTLQEWCIELLGNKIQETEYLDKDARDSKETQLLYLYEIVESFKSNELKSFSKMISRELYDFLDNDEHWSIAELLQSEISTYIKGRAGESLERYRKISRSKYLIPIKKDEDFDCIYALYNKYNERLISLGQFDSDDIVLTAIGELETPIWRRRRIVEGVDAIYIDETHLFNMNELCLFHFLTKPDSTTNIVFTIDRSQALGDSTLSSGEVRDALNINDNGEIETEGFNTIFRCSPEIIDLANHILSSGAGLFTDFENPLSRSSGSFTMEEEKKCVAPYIKSIPNDKDLLMSAFDEVDLLHKKLECSRSNIVIIPTTDSLCKDIEKLAMEINKPFEIIKNRGDIQKVNDAQKGGKYIISGIDYVGGLEFDAVVIVGADKGRLPPTEVDVNTNSKHYLTYISFNRLYVAITRARFAVAMLYSGARGISELLQTSIEDKFLDSV